MKTTNGEGMERGGKGRKKIKKRKRMGGIKERTGKG
jgi:hypothetical protein